MIFDRVQDTRAFMKHLDKIGLKSTLRMLGGNVNEVQVCNLEDGDQYLKFIQRKKTVLETVLPKRDAFKESV